MLAEGMEIDIKVLDYLFGRPDKLKDRRSLKIDIIIKNGTE